MGEKERTEGKDPGVYDRAVGKSRVVVTACLDRLLGCSREPRWTGWRASIRIPWSSGGGLPGAAELRVLHLGRVKEAWRCSWGPRQRGK